MARTKVDVPDAEDALSDLIGVTGGPSQVSPSPRNGSAAAKVKEERPAPAPEPPPREQPKTAAAATSIPAAQASAPESAVPAVTSVRQTPSQAAVEPDLPMPPRKTEAEIRKPFGTKLTPEITQRLKNFAFAHDAEIQDIVEQALDEYMTRRGMPRAV